MTTSTYRRTFRLPLRLSLSSTLALPLAVMTGTASASAQTVVSPAWAPALDSAMAAELLRTGTPGAQVAVVVDGKIVYSKGFGVADIETGRAVTDRTLFRVGSVTKMVTAATASQLAAEGKLDLQAPISTYVPEIAGKRVGAVTMNLLLSHSAGWLDNAVAYGRMGEGALGEVFREVSDTMFFTEPGRVYSYSNPGFSMAGYVIERAAKQRFASAVDALVIKKMGMANATFRPLEAMTKDFSQGHIALGTTPPAIVRPFTENTAQWAAGFLFASAGEMARFTIALMNGGMLDGQRVLSADAVTHMTTGHRPIPANPESSYGYGLVITQGKNGLVWQHGGSINGFDAQVTMLPARKLAVIVFDNRSGGEFRGITDLVVQRATGIAPTPPPVLPGEREASPAERAALVGTFKQGGLSISLIVVDGALMFRQGDATLPVKLVGDERIVVIPPQGDKITFIVVRDDNGRVQYITRSSRALARQP